MTNSRRELVCDVLQVLMTAPASIPDLSKRIGVHEESVRRCVRFLHRERRIIYVHAFRNLAKRPAALYALQPSVGARPDAVYTPKPRKRYVKPAPPQTPPVARPELRSVFAWAEASA